MQANRISHLSCQIIVPYEPHEHYRGWMDFLSGDISAWEISQRAAGTTGRDDTLQSFPLCAALPGSFVFHKQSVMKTSLIPLPFACCSVHAFFFRILLYFLSPLQANMQCCDSIRSKDGQGNDSEEWWDTVKTGCDLLPLRHAFCCRLSGCVVVCSLPVCV